MSEHIPSDRLRRWLAPPLIVFVLISIGFALGRLSASRAREVATPEPSLAQASVQNQSRVLVQYFHGDIRCVTCNTIEGMLRTCLDAHYAEAQKAGILIFSQINFDQNEALAARYDISSSIPVLAYEIDGAEDGAHQLEAVWELKGNQEYFDDYIIEEIDAAFENAGIAQWKSAKP